MDCAKEPDEILIPIKQDTYEKKQVLTIDSSLASELYDKMQKEKNRRFKFWKVKV